MSTNRTRPAGRHDRCRPEAVPPQRTRTPQRPRAPRRLRPHHWFAERLLAVLSGQRPVHWMLGHTIGEAYDQLAELAPRTPLGSRGVRPVIRMCHGAQPVPGVVEACASIAAGDRVRAIAFRLEQGRDLRWRCAAVELGDEHQPAATPR